VRVRAPKGPRTIVRFHGASALWQAAGTWGTLAGERTISVFPGLPEARLGTAGTFG
jgi:hypothetical protein